MSRLSQGQVLEVAVVAAVTGGVVWGVGVPAGPDHAQPGAGEDADRVGVAAAAGACVVVDAFGPGACVSGVVGEEHEGFAGLGVGRVAEADGSLLAASFRDRAGAAERGGLLGGGGAVEQGS